MRDVDPTIPAVAAGSTAAIITRSQPRRPGSRRLFREPAAIVGFVVVAVFILVALLAPWISPYTPSEQDIPLLPPGSPDHLLGTDSLGRDVYAIMVYGSRVSLLFAFLGAGISAATGILLGAVPAFYGGRIDDFAARAYEIVLMIPQLFLIITVVVLAGAHVWLVVILIGLTIWPSNAKIMRSQVLTLRNSLFVDAALASGRGRMSTLLTHVVPNAVGAVIANSTLQMAEAVLIEAGLSFLGLSDPNTASWGLLLNQGQNYISSAPWLIVLPGVALTALLIGLHLVGDAVSGYLDPRSSRARKGSVKR